MKIRSIGQDEVIDFGVAPSSIQRIEAPVTAKARFPTWLIEGPMLTMPTMRRPT